MNDIATNDIETLPTLAYAPRDFPQLVQFAEVISKTNLCPAAYRGKPHETIAAIMHGAELGLAPMQALNSVAVVNGQTTVYGATAMALTKNQWLWDESKFAEYYFLNGEEVSLGDLGPAESWPAELTAICAMGRRDGRPHEGRFSVQQAKDAGLWSRQSKGGQSMPWGAYPGDMLMWKARARAIKSVFPGALRGLQVVQDMQGETIDVTPERPPTAAMDNGAKKLLKGTEGLKAKVRGGRASTLPVSEAKPEARSGEAPPLRGSRSEKAPPPPPPAFKEEEAPPLKDDDFDAEAWNKHLNQLYKEKASKTDFRNHLADAQGQCTDPALLEACKERWNKAMDAMEAPAT